MSTKTGKISIKFRDSYISIKPYPLEQDKLKKTKIVIGLRLSSTNLILNLNPDIINFNYSFLSEKYLNVVNVPVIIMLFIK